MQPWPPCFLFGPLSQVGDSFWSNFIHESYHMVHHMISIYVVGALYAYRMSINVHVFIKILYDSTEPSEPSVPSKPSDLAQWGSFVESSKTSARPFYPHSESINMYFEPLVPGYVGFGSFPSYNPCSPGVAAMVAHDGDRFDQVGHKLWVNAKLRTLRYR